MLLSSGPSSRAYVSTIIKGWFVVVDLFLFYYIKTVLMMLVMEVTWMEVFVASHRVVVAASFFLQSV